MVSRGNSCANAHLSWYISLFVGSHIEMLPCVLGQDSYVSIVIGMYQIGSPLRRTYFKHSITILNTVILLFVPQLAWLLLELSEPLANSCTELPISDAPRFHPGWQWSTDPCIECLHWYSDYQQINTYREFESSLYGAPNTKVFIIRNDYESVAKWSEW